jgi:lysophospholipase L1-like esterase
MIKRKFLLKRLVTAACFVLLAGSFLSCSHTDDSSEEDTPQEGNYSNPSTTPTIYLAGDSTVKTYTDEQYIAGWGQYLGLFLDQNVPVINCAQGGRSSRSFINEGRLYKIDNPNYSYTFTENNGKSIEECIHAGDFLFIQFGHNDDDTKAFDDTSYKYQRMVPLDVSHTYGSDYAEIKTFPVTSAEKTSTTENLPADMSAATKTEIAKYGSTYYPYGSGSYKWYLKQYIDFARKQGAVPVLVTPVARVKFESDGKTLASGQGLHGSNWAYVQAVRQLAAEENCLLIDLFDSTKTFLETETSSYADYLMALCPNDLTGKWPQGYDTTYGNAAAGFTKIEATHYNKYGAFVTAAACAERILSNTATSGEYFAFKSHILTTPSGYVDPPTLISKTSVAELESLFTKVTVTNPDRSYASPAAVVAEITEKLSSSAENAETLVTNATYLSYQTICEEIRDDYNALNVDDKSSVTNLAILVAFEAKVSYWVEFNTPEPVGVEVLTADGQGWTSEQSITAGVSGSTTASGTAQGHTFTIYGSADKPVTIKTSANSTTYHGDTYTTSNYISLGGSASFGSYRYIEFETSGACTVTVILRSSGTTSRTLNMVSAADGAAVTSFDAGTSTAAVSKDISNAGKYWIGSASSGILVYDVIIEYYK